MNNFERPIHFNREDAAVWTRYYSGQSRTGNGIPGYQGNILYQKGNGFWGSLLRWSLPIVKYLGKRAATTVVKAGSEALAGENFVESLKKHGKETAKDIVGDSATAATSLLQRGSGRKRRRGAKKSNKAKKSKRTKRKRITRKKYGKLFV